MHLDNDNRRIMIALLGLPGEVGEVVDLYKKHYFHGHDLDMDKVEKELGDVMWYVALLCDAAGIKLEEVLEKNIAKLRARYGEKFSCEASRSRVV